MERKHNDHESIKPLNKLWIHTDIQDMKCPHCNGDLSFARSEEIQDWKNPYPVYDSMVECKSCSFQAKAKSCTIMGSVKDYTVDNMTISGWSPTGSRVDTHVEHLLDYSRLKELKSSEELVEFMIIDDHVIDVIDE